MRFAAQLVVLLLMTGVAGADGEQTPQFGGGVIGTRDAEAEIVGANLELAVWWGRFGLAVEGSRQWSIDPEDPRVTTLGASARVLLFRQLMPSLLEPRDVELGIELQGIVERSWWENVDREPVAYGAGLAVRLRGGSDDFSNLIAESRLFVRVMAARRTQAETIARDTMADPEDRGLSVVIGLGALFGGGEPKYVERFRPRPLDTQLSNLR